MGRRRFGGGLKKEMLASGSWVGKRGPDRGRRDLGNGDQRRRRRRRRRNGRERKELKVQAGRVGRFR